MELSKILSDYDAITKACRQLLEQELLNVRNGASPADDFEERKRQMIEQLDQKLSELKSIRSGLLQITPELKSELDLTQNRFMQIMQLNRELEKCYLATNRSGRPDAKPKISAVVRRYQQG
jgi:hypothetical protein